MVLDTKKGLLKADKEKRQYVDAEKRNSKEEKEKENIFFDRSSRQSTDQV
jgi:hypothetical protein